MIGPARLSCRSGIARSGAARSGAILTAQDSLEPRQDDGVTTAKGWALDVDVTPLDVAIPGQLSPGWTLDEPS